MMKTENVKVIGMMPQKQIERQIISNEETWKAAKEKYSLEKLADQYPGAKTVLNSENQGYDFKKIDTIIRTKLNERIDEELHNRTKDAEKDPYYMNARRLANYLLKQLPLLRSEVERCSMEIGLDAETILKVRIHSLVLPSEKETDEEEVWKHPKLWEHPKWTNKYDAEISRWGFYQEASKTSSTEKGKLEGDKSFPDLSYCRGPVKFRKKPKISDLSDGKMTPKR